ncbi:sporulation protein [Lysobacteraceae bacterium NML75-0749]|nr:sporulation protein [Xanthomonadaceae bacterium NML75-0749]PJK03705.1 sporulation protein [Xanthomonadaceae bacterium NML91-0268]
MAARRGKSQARRSSARQSGMPGWAWLLIGVLLTIVVILLAPRFIGAYKEGNTGFFSLGNTSSTPEPLPQPDASSTPAFEPAPATPPKRQPQSAPAHQEPPKTRDFDFYEVLPNEEVALTDAQLAAIQREETRRREEAARRREQAAATANQTPTPSAAAASDSAAAQAADAQARAVAAAANAPLPRPLPEATVPARRTATPAPPTAAATPAAKAPATRTPPVTAPSPATPPKPASAAATSTPAAAANTATQTVARSAPYIVQAGAFAASGDAEAAKARIALLGLNARVESAQINGKTVYRVRMGPYGSAAEAADAKQKLESGGVQAMTLQVK